MARASTIGLISADSHVNEPRDLWSSNLPPHLLDIAMRGIEAGDDPMPRAARKAAAVFERARRQAAKEQARLRRRRFSPLTRRILTLNVLVLAIPVLGLLYLDEYREGLIQSRLTTLRTEAELISGAIATSGVVTGPLGDERPVFVLLHKDSELH